MQIVIAQLNPIIGDLSGNAQKILAAAYSTPAKESQLLLTPELSLCGYPPKDLLLNPYFVREMDLTLQQLAKDLPPNLTVLVGTVTANLNASINGGKNLFNSVALLAGNKVENIFHKRLLPTYDVFDERRYFEPGTEANYFNLDGIDIGVTICEDLWNNEDFFGKLSYGCCPIDDLSNIGVDLVINLSASPYITGKQDLREKISQHVSRRLQKPTIYANQVGSNDDLIFDGRSFAHNRQGELVCRAQGFVNDLIILEFDPIQRDFLPGSIATKYECVDEERWHALVLGVREYSKKCGFTQVLLGLSGGIDSALVASIATAALGKENVLGVLMPSPYSSQHSVTDALELSNNLGIRTQIFPIGELMSCYAKTLGKLFSDGELGHAEENIQSRIRGNLLMAIANKSGHLLLSTGNKSEMAVGYCTLYGDMNGGLAVIADMPKTYVYSLCRWLNLQGRNLPLNGLGENSNCMSGEIIPHHILTKPPSAELKPDQVDQDSLPEYEILDDILQRLFQDHQSVNQIVAAGHNEILVDRVMQMVARSEFKRRQAPPILKITDRAFGTGWRMPIASNWSALKNSYWANNNSSPNAYIYNGKGCSSDNQGCGT